MAFTSSTLGVIVQPIGSEGMRFINYRTDDDQATVTGTGYFEKARSFGIRVHDLIFVSPLAASFDPYILMVDAVDGEGNATAAIGDYEYTSAERDKLAGIETGADKTDATNVAAAGALMSADMLDDDTFATATDDKPASSESIKAYADTKVSKANNGSDFDDKQATLDTLAQLDGTKKGYDFATDKDGLHSVILQPTFLNPTRRWAIDGTGSVDDLAAHQAAWDWAVTNGRSLQYPEGDFTVNDQIGHISSGNLVASVNGVNTTSPGNGLRIFGKGEDDTILKMGSSFPDSTALISFNGNENEYTKTSENSGQPVGQGKNILAGIGLWGRGKSTGTDNRAIDIGANWDLHMHDFKCVGFSGNMINFISSAAVGHDDVDSNARIQIERFSLLGGGDNGIEATVARIVNLAMRDFEIRNIVNDGIIGCFVGSEFRKFIITACGSDVSHGGMQLLHSLTGAYCRGVEIFGQFENNYGYELNIAEGREVDAKITLSLYQPTGVVLAKKGVIVGAGAENCTIKDLIGSNYSNNEGYKIPYITVLAGAVDTIIDNPRFGNATDHIVIGACDGVELRNIPSEVRTDAAAAYPIPAPSRTDPIDISIDASATNVTWNGRVVRSGDKYTVGQIGDGQYAFPATQNASTDANVLDDYEEGMWTPVVAGATTAGVGTYSVQTGFYTKIGRMVQFSCTVSMSAHTGTGDMTITGLPFTAAQNVAASLGIGTLTYTSPPWAEIVAATSTILIRQAASGAGVSGVAIDGSCTLKVTGVFHV